jgi:ATP-dependent DNA helicase DinG
MDALAALDRVVACLPAGGEPRAGQRDMVAAVERALTDRRHLLVEAGTGTGKSLAYLIPAVLSGQRTVVVTATKALQEQLVRKDIPFLQRHLGVPFDAALLKGRSNYLCRAKLAALADPAQQQLSGVDVRSGSIREIRDWAERTTSGDRADLPSEVPHWAWQTVSVESRECPGAARCPHGPHCLAEHARDQAAAADVVVVNAHLYGMHLASGGFVLPPHDVVVLDEAHTVEDVMAAVFGIELDGGRFEQVARAARGVFTRDADVIEAVARAGDGLDRILRHLSGRVDPTGPDLAPALALGQQSLAVLVGAAQRLPANGELDGARQRLVSAADALRGDLGDVLGGADGTVCWVEQGVLKVATVDVGPRLSGALFAQATVVATSATLTTGGSFTPLARRLGLRGDADHEAYDELAVASPFDYEAQAVLYCPVHLPDPRAPGYPAAMLEELEALIRAAGGRTLALFTSRRACEEASAALAPRLPFKILVQDTLPRPVLLERFAADEASCLFATMGFWQGIDVAGRTCSLVTIDRLPFPRPDEPLFVARRDAAARRREDPFQAIDLPRAATLLAQGVGRLVRTTDDRGAVAVFDRRLAKSSYAWTLVRSLPPMRRTRHRHEVEAFLRS